KIAEKTGQLDELARGKKSMVFDDEELARDNDIVYDDKQIVESGDELDNLEDELNSMYQQYKESKMERDARLRAK
ncbi:hypothetical protein WICPIJ_004944, partial [Wickerhamomyces pijperi]